MPTVEDLGKKVKEKYPGQYDDIKDADLGKKIKAKYPKDYADFSDAGFSQPKTALQKQAASRKLGIEVEQHAATQDQEISNAKGKFAGHVAETAVLGAAGLATGGLALAPALATMGAAGAVGGLAREGAKSIAGSNEIPMTAKDLTKRLTVDAVMGAAGEGVARAIPAAIKYVSKELVPSLVMKSAAKSEAGQNVIKELQGKTLDGLRALADAKPYLSSAKVNIAPDYVAFKNALAKRVTGLSRPFEERMVGIEAKLHANGGDSIKGLMEIKSDLNHLTYKLKGINTDEFRAARDFTQAVEKKITGKLSELGDTHAVEMWKQFKDFTKLQRDHDIAGGMAEQGIEKLLGVGAKVPGVSTAIEAGREKLAPALLEHIFSTEKGATLLKKAITLAKDSPSAAQRTFEAAMKASNAGTTFAPKIKEWLSSLQAKQPTMGSVVNPEKGPDRSSLIEKSDLPGSGSTAEANSRGRGDYQPTRADAQHMEQRLAIENKKETKLDREQFKKDQEGFKNERESMKMMDILKSGASKRTKRKALSMLLELEDKK